LKIARKRESTTPSPAELLSLAAKRGKKKERRKRKILSSLKKKEELPHGSVLPVRLRKEKRREAGRGKEAQKNFMWCRLAISLGRRGKRGKGRGGGGGGARFRLGPLTNPLALDKAEKKGKGKGKKG